MNKVILMGRLTRDPEIRWTQGEDAKCVARFTMAVDRKVKKDAAKTADFISCISFGKIAEFLEKYGKRGVKFVTEGRWQTGSYEKDGVKIYTNDCLVESIEFAESKSSSEPQIPAAGPAGRVMDEDGFMNIPDGIDEELPFN